MFLKYSTRRGFLKSLGLGTAALIMPGCMSVDNRIDKQSFEDKFNVLFIAVDDLNNWVVQPDRKEMLHVPNFNRLASKGVLFSNAHCPSPACAPSRTSVMTGVSPSTSGITDNVKNEGEVPFWRLNEVLRDSVTIPEYFRGEGYSAAGSGKIFHAVQYDAESENDPDIWDYYYPDPINVIPKQVTPKGFSAAKNREAGRPAGYFDWTKLDVKDEQMSGYEVADWAIRELKKKHDKPFFRAVGFFRPHVPWHVPKEYYDLYPLDKIELPEDLIRESQMPLPLASDRTSHHDKGCLARHKWILENNKWKEAMQGYLASVSFFDAMLGRVLDALEASEYADNTIVVLWSDNGMHLGEKGRWSKFTLWQESTHVPLIVVVPGLTKPGRVCKRAASLLDIYPTLVDLTGGGIGRQLEGVSLSPQLRNPKAPRKEPAITTIAGNNQSVRLDNWCYIRYQSGIEELYDLKNDPDELHNLAKKQEYVSVKKELAKWLQTPKQ